MDLKRILEDKLEKRDASKNISLARKTEVSLLNIMKYQLPENDSKVQSDISERKIMQEIKKIEYLENEYRKDIAAEQALDNPPESNSGTESD